MSIIYFLLAFELLPLPTPDAIFRRCPSHPEDFLIAAEENAANYLRPTLSRARSEPPQRSCFPDADLAAFLRAFSYIYSNSHWPDAGGRRILRCLGFRLPTRCPHRLPWLRCLFPATDVKRLHMTRSGFPTN